MYLCLQQESSQGVSSKAPPGCWAVVIWRGILTEVKRILSACLVRPPAPHLRMTNNRYFWCCLQTRQRVSNLFHLFKQLVYSCLFFFLFSTAKLWNYFLGTNPSGKQRCDHLLPPVCSMSLVFEKKLKSQLCLLCLCEVCYCRKDKLMSIPAYFTFIGNWKDIL